MSSTVTPSRIPTGKHAESRSTRNRLAMSSDRPGRTATGCDEVAPPVVLRRVDFANHNHHLGDPGDGNLRKIHTFPHGPKAIQLEDARSRARKAWNEALFITGSALRSGCALPVLVNHAVQLSKSSDNTANLTWSSRYSGALLRGANTSTLPRNQIRSFDCYLSGLFRSVGANGTYGG
jgi:hypothetical protein